MVDLRSGLLGRLAGRLLGPAAAPVMRVHAATVFYSFFRLHMTLAPASVGLRPDAAGTARLLFGADQPPQSALCRPDGAGGWEIVLEALVDRSRFPDAAALEIADGAQSWQVPVPDLLAAAAEPVHPLFPHFQDAIAHRVAAMAPARPRLLDIGGRARSGVQRSEHFPDCEVTTLDIVADPGVDVVGDAHALSAHFPPESFDFAMSVAVFEHLAMPWKAAVEMGKVLRTGGLALIFTHQTIGMHDMPWDFFRFSDQAWRGLFNRRTGFAIVATQLSTFMHIVPRAWAQRHQGAEAAGGFEGSAVLVRRIGPPDIDWPVALGEFLDTRYPTG